MARSSVLDDSGPKWHAPPCSESAQLKRRVSARRGGDYNEVPQAIQKKSRPSPSNCVTPSACKLKSEQGFGFRKANVVECRVFASHFPSDEVQNEAEVRARGSTPVSPTFLVPLSFNFYWNLLADFPRYVLRNEDRIRLGEASRIIVY